ncbi:ice-binding family protein [Streptomyces sp. NPDC051064]|uniref:ice-binding family protein n=1 Tax=Streptomyces sp. NPDC051064 TaxID=3365641 RepID=UPI00378DD77A
MSGALASAVAATAAAVMVAVTPTPASAIALPVPLGTAASYSVLSGQGVTNTGNSVLGQSLGTHPNPAITGFPPGVVQGAVHPADAPALQAKSDLLVGFNNAAGQAPDFALAPGIGAGQTLAPGVHHASVGLGITGDLILDADGDSSAVWVFQVPESLTTASNSRILLTDGASACNVYWQIGVTATLGTTSTFVGTLMAGTSITVDQGTNIQGRALASNGSVTLNNNRISQGNCSPTTTGGATNGGPTTGGAIGGVLGGVLGGVSTGGGVLGGPIAGTVTGGTSGNISGNTSGNVAGNTTGGDTAGNVTGGNGGQPGGPGHGGPGNGEGPGHGGGPDNGEGPGHGGGPDNGEGPGHGGGPDQGHEGKPGHGPEGKPGHGPEGKPGHSPDEKPGEHHGYGDKPDEQGGPEGHAG